MQLVDGKPFRLCGEISNDSRRSCSITFKHLWSSKDLSDKKLSQDKSEKTIGMSVENVFSKS